MDRSVLEERMRGLEAVLARLDRDADSIRADRSDATADDEHDPEGSTLSGEWQRIDALRRATLAERTALDAALARVKAGTYGVCARCGQEIPAARLEIRPDAVTCVACAD